MAQRLRHFFFRKRMRLFQSSPARGGRVQLQQAFAMHGAFQRFNPHPPVGAGATHIHSIPHPQALSPAGGRLGASGGGYRWIQMDTVISESPLKARVLGDFPKLPYPSVSIRIHRFHACGAPKKSPAPCLGGREARSGIQARFMRRGRPARRACAGVSRASSARAYSPAACWWGGSPSPPTVARRWLR
jgi:hypothetical protein